MKRIGFLFLLVQLCMISCTTVTSERRDIVTLVQADSFILPLDSLTTQTPAYVQLMNDSTLAFYNSASHNICITDLNKKKYDIIQLHKEGPDAILWIDAFYMCNDTLWIYESWGKKITALDMEGRIIKSLVLPIDKEEVKEKLEYAVYPFPTSNSPYIVKNGSHMLQGFGGGRLEGQKLGTTMIYNELTGEVVTDNPYPAVYGDDDDMTGWPIFAYCNISYASMPDGKMLINFPASDSLYIYNPQNRQRVSIDASYSKPTNIKRAAYKSKEEEIKATFERYRYDGILYDRYNDVYYRFIALPVTNVDAENPWKTPQSSAVIILDKELKIIGETVLPDSGYGIIDSFVNSEGLHLKYHSEDDDFMVYRVFKLAEK